MLALLALALLAALIATNLTRDDNSQVRIAAELFSLRSRLATAHAQLEHSQAKVSVAWCARVR